MKIGCMNKGNVSYKSLIFGIFLNYLFSFSFWKEGILARRYSKEISTAQ